MDMMIGFAESQQYPEFLACIKMSEVYFHDLGNYLNFHLYRTINCSEKFVNIIRFDEIGKAFT